MSKLRYLRALAEVGKTKPSKGRIVNLTDEIEPRGGKKSTRTSRRVYR